MQTTSREWHALAEGEGSSPGAVAQHGFFLIFPPALLHAQLLGVGRRGLVWGKSYPRSAQRRGEGRRQGLREGTQCRA